MWLNVIEARFNTRQCWPVVSTTNRIYNFAHVAFACSSYSCFLRPTLPPLWKLFLVSSNCASFHWGSKCDGARWVPLSGLSWLPSRLAYAPFLFHQAPSPHTYIVDGFNHSLHGKKYCNIHLVVFFLPLSLSTQTIWFTQDHEWCTLYMWL